MRKYDPFEELKRLQREMDRLFSDWDSDRYLALPGPKREHELLPGIAREPLTDVKETEKEIIASLEMPGVDKKDIQLNVTEDGLEVKVEQKHEAKEEKEGYIRMERGYRSFYRSLPFPSKVIPEKANAKYDKGVLEITIPKINETKKKKLIEIK
ncbi:MAG: Hsp20/alpha crystallin family protein [archaeon]